MGLFWPKKLWKEQTKPPDRGKSMILGLFWPKIVGFHPEKGDKVSLVTTKRATLIEKISRCRVKAVQWIATAILDLALCRVLLVETI